MRRFDGSITGLGTASGTRLVLGIWAQSPFGPIADAMVERPDGHRILIAPTTEVADFIAATYHFDEVRVERTTALLAGSTRTVHSASLQLSFDLGARTAVGALLRLVPRPLARTRWWCRGIDPVARRARPGVRTVGTAGGGRREYYCALDEHVVTAVRAALDGADLGPLTEVMPPVHFGFGSTPARPALVRMTTLVDENLSGRPE